ncbi:Hypothetical predicted protein [Paramuricea clavata]|uniref:Uncharacterized protein n=1 Tax=Paramuricea clavata TaxID=317549 RepID=A0A6S7IZI1_PARCT|nr:Hypothetical predicted protein [Paramuricea clavata]
MSRLTFVEMVLSGNGINCTEEKVRAVVEVIELELASEVRSFLGLVNYCGRFIPDLATILEHLRCQTKKGAPFNFGSEQTESFQELKNRLSSTTTLVVILIKTHQLK